MYAIYVTCMQYMLHVCNICYMYAIYVTSVKYNQYIQVL